MALITRLVNRKSHKHPHKINPQQPTIVIQTRNNNGTWLQWGRSTSYYIAGVIVIFVFIISLQYIYFGFNETNQFWSQLFKVVVQTINEKTEDEHGDGWFGPVEKTPSQKLKKSVVTLISIILIIVAIIVTILLFSFVKFLFSVYGTPSKRQTPEMKAEVSKLMEMDDETFQRFTEDTLKEFTNPEDSFLYSFRITAIAYAEKAYNERVKEIKEKMEVQQELMRKNPTNSITPEFHSLSNKLRLLRNTGVGKHVLDLAVDDQDKEELQELKNDVWNINEREIHDVIYNDYIGEDTFVFKDDTKKKRYILKTNIQELETRSAKQLLGDEYNPEKHKGLFIWITNKNGIDENAWVIQSVDDAVKEADAMDAELYKKEQELSDTQKEFLVFMSEKWGSR